MPLILQNMSTQLGMLDKRTIELFLCRLERDPPPSHLADLTICDFIENKGRERRHRYYTLAGYLSLVQTENIDLADRTAQYTSKDFSQSGGFSIFSDNLFYKDEAALVKYGDEYRGKAKPPKGGGTRKLGQPRKDGAKSRKEPMPEREASMSQKPSRKRGKTAKPIADTESGDDQPVVPQKSAQKGTKRKRRDDGEEDEPESQPALKQRRGRSVKKIPQTEGSVTDMDSATAAPVQEKKRGRPRRATAHSSLENAGSQDINPDSADAGNSKTSNEFSITPHPNPLPSEPVGKDGAVSSTEWMSGDGPTLPVVAGVSGPDPLGIIHPIPLSHSTAPIVGKSALPRRVRFLIKSPSAFYLMDVFSCRLRPPSIYKYLVSAALPTRPLKENASSRRILPFTSTNRQRNAPNRGGRGVHMSSSTYPNYVPRTNLCALWKRLGASPTSHQINSLRHISKSSRQ